MPHSFDLMLASHCAPTFDGIQICCSLPADSFSPPLPAVWPRLQGESRGLPRKLHAADEEAVMFFFKSGADLHHLGFSCRRGRLRPDLLMANRQASGRLLLEERRRGHFVGNLVIGYYSDALSQTEAARPPQAPDDLDAAHQLSFAALRRWAAAQGQPQAGAAQRLHLHLHNQKSHPLACHLDLEQGEVLGAIKAELHPGQGLEWLVTLSPGQFLWVLLDQAGDDTAGMVLWLDNAAARPRASHIIAHHGATASIIHRPGKQGTWPIELAAG